MAVFETKEVGLLCVHWRIFAIDFTGAVILHQMHILKAYSTLKKATANL